MKKLMTLMLGLSLVIGATSLFAEDKKEEPKKAKKAKKAPKKAEEKK